MSEDHNLKAVLWKIAQALIHILLHDINAALRGCNEIIWVKL